MGKKQHPKDKKKQAKKKANKPTAPRMADKKSPATKKKRAGQAIASRFLEKQSNQTLCMIVDRKLNGWETADKILKKRTAR